MRYVLHFKLVYNCRLYWLKMCTRYIQLSYTTITSLHFVSSSSPTRKQHHQLLHSFPASFRVGFSQRCQVAVSFSRGTRSGSWVASLKTGTFPVVSPSTCVRAGRGFVLTSHWSRGSRCYKFVTYGEEMVDWSRDTSKSRVGLLLVNQRFLIYNLDNEK